MYLFEEVRDNCKNYDRCHICGSIYPTWKCLSKHVDQQSKNNPGSHPILEEYEKLYFLLGDTF
jgi:hypothetical protein